MHHAVLASGVFPHDLGELIAEGPIDVAIGIEVVDGLLDGILVDGVGPTLQQAHGTMALLDALVLHQVTHRLRHSRRVQGNQDLTRG